METKKAYVAGGCFWGMEELFRTQDGIIDTEVGYMGGENENPTYRNHPGHAEAMEIEYDSSVTSYKNILDYFFRIHNPTTLNQQGNDRGTSYRSAIFPQTLDEKSIAQDFIKIVNDSGRWPDTVITTIEDAQDFWQAESEHQDYLQDTPNGYTCHYVRWPTYL